MAERTRGTSTSNFGVSKRENHDASAFYARFAPPHVSADHTVAPATDVDRIIVGDSRAMTDVPDGSVALVVTSPPYFAGKAYEEALGEGAIPATYLDYLQMLRDVFAECVRVLEPGGRIAVNVANLGRRPYRSLAADVTTILQDDLRLLLRGEVVWVKQRGASGSCAWGSFQRPGNPVLRDVSERVIVASKGRFDRALDAKQRAKAGLPSISSLTRDEFMEATLDVWELPAESASRVGHPAPFPVALPERLIHLHTYVGDVVLDPFMGSGSTAVAAKRTGRHFLGYDTDRRRTSPRRWTASLASRRPRPVSSCPPGATAPAIRCAPVGRRRSSPRQRSPTRASSSWSRRSPLRPACSPRFRAVDRRGRTWWFEVAGGRTGSRPGLQRVEVLWRAIAKGAVVAAARPADGFVVLSWGLPSAASGGAALAAVTGPDRPVTAVVDLGAADAMALLAGLESR